MRAVGGHQMAPPHSPGVAPDAPLDAALAYAARGWRVVPIIPGQKRPPLGQWTEVATCDPDRIRQWWGGRYADHGVGIVCGWNAERTACLFVVDIDEGHTDGVSGGDTLAELEAVHGALPATMEVVTGSGGRHLYFVADEEVGTGANRLGPGVDTRGEGGQVLAPPTFHPNGTRYEWEASSAAEPASAPAWLLDLLRPAAPPTPPPALPAAADAVGQRPGDLWAAQTTWAELLEVDGWTLHHVDRDGEQHWTRPGKDRREGTSATLGYRGSDVLKVFTSSVPWLTPDATYSRLGYLAARDHNGDHRAAARALAAEGWTTRPDDDLDAILPSTAATPPAATPEGDEGRWVEADGETIASILDGDFTRPEATELLRSDGQGLLYPGKVHSFIGEPGAGKTWLALIAILRALQAGDEAMYIDWEDSVETAILRLTALGATRQQVMPDRFHYITPGMSAKGGSVPDAIIEVAKRCRLVVIDSVGEAMADVGVTQNDDDAVALWGRRVPRSLARTGATVVTLDHVPKDKEKRGHWAIGSQRKLAAIDGAAYGVTTVVPFSRSKEGIVKITVAKDRPGTFPRGSAVAIMEMRPAGDGIHFTLKKDGGDMDDGKWRPTHLMERVSRYVEAAGDEAPSGRQILADVGGKTDHLRVALSALVEDGHLVVERREGRGGGQVYRCERPFRDALDEGLDLPISEPRPTAPNRAPGAVHETAPPTAPPVGGRGAVRGSEGSLPIGEPRPTLDLDYEPII